MHGQDLTDDVQEHIALFLRLERAAPRPLRAVNANFVAAVKMGFAACGEKRPPVLKGR